MTNSSASRFPSNPADEELRQQYDAMRSALISVNISRGGSTAARARSAVW